MNRRGFLTTCATAVGGVAVLGAGTGKVFAAESAVPGDRPFSKLPIRMSAPVGWFQKGRTMDEALDEVAKWGLPAYEWLGAGGDPAPLRKKADALGLELSCMGGAGAIAPGQMVKVEDHDRLVQTFTEKVAFAKAANCKHLIGLSGNTRDDISTEQQTENVVTCLKRLAPIAEQNDVLLVLEMLNPLVDHKGYFLTRTAQGVEIIKAVNSKNVKLLFDIYHQQITEGNVIRNFKENIDVIGHFHVADNPGRKYPGTGELNYKNIFRAIADTGYQHFVALECGWLEGENYENALKATLACFA